MFVYQSSEKSALARLVGAELCAYRLADIPSATGMSSDWCAYRFLVRGRSPAGLSLSADKYWGENHERTCSSIWAAPLSSCSAGYFGADLRGSARRRADHQHQHHERFPSLRRRLVRLGGCLSICNRGGQWSRGSDESQKCAHPGYRLGPLRC